MEILPRNTSDITACFEESYKECRKKGLINPISETLKVILTRNPTKIDTKYIATCDRLTLEYIQNSTAPDVSNLMIIKRLLTVAHRYAQHLYTQHTPIDPALEDKLYKFTMYQIIAKEKDRVKRLEKINIANMNGEKRLPEKEYMSGEIFLHASMLRIANDRFKKTNDPLWLARAYYHSEQCAKKTEVTNPRKATYDYLHCSGIAYTLYKITEDRFWKEEAKRTQRHRIDLLKSLKQ